MASNQKKRTKNDQDQIHSSAKRNKTSSSTLSFLPPKGDLSDLASQPVHQLQQQQQNQVSNGVPSKVASAEEIARKRAEIAAKFASFKNPSASLNRPQAGLASTMVPTALNPMLSAPNIDPNLAKKVAEARKTVEELAAKAKNPYLSHPSAPAEPIGSGATSGVHPLLMAQDSSSSSTSSGLKNRYKPMVPKFATVKANARPSLPTTSSSSKPDLAEALLVDEEAVDQRSNPHFDRSLAGPLGDPSGVHRSRPSRSLRFNPKGKFVRLAEQIRAEARLEELKKRIAESSRKAGLDGEIEAVEKQVRRPAPPDCEWWDEDYLPNRTYDDLESGEASKLIRSSEDSPITLYIQHPIQLPGPGDRNKVELKPLKLTKAEQKKMRRQRRMAELQDKQDRQRMGLLPPDPPKVKLSNMMKVLTSDAVADPTKIEARVRREMLQRRKAHEKANESRKLTDEQRKEKIEKKRAADETRGIFTSVYKIKYLTNPSHRFKVRRNAQQHGLTGVLIFNPRFALVVVEGGSKGIRAYKHLMLYRIDWTEEPRARSPTNHDNEGKEKGEGEEEEGAPISLANNKCEMIWEGEGRERAFKEFRPKNCPSDSIAKEFLGSKLGFWDVAKKWGEDTVG
ncbi:pre-mRNA processing factor 3-domain-containing protein [Melampsora americana]|nr:pre-mRNA processing factor 3-domain-containing protein [Melampsora americana]